MRRAMCLGSPRRLYRTDADRGCQRTNGVPNSRCDDSHGLSQDLWYRLLNTDPTRRAHNRPGPPTAMARTVSRPAYLRLIPMPVRTGPRYPLPVSRGHQLAYGDAYARSSAARVLAVEPADPPTVLLDRTVFYPGGGGQPPDTGTLRHADGRVWAVRSARKSDGNIVHELEPTDGLPSVGDEVVV